MPNIAVVGYGYWGPNIVRNFQETSGGAVKMCCDSSAQRIAQINAKYPEIKTTTVFDDVINNKSIDAVVIATPVKSHYEFARKALEHGKHVLVEKPMTASAAEAEKLVEIAAEKKLILMVDHTFIYTGAVRKMRQIVDSGDLGSLYYFDSVRVNLGLLQKDVNVLWDLAPHDIAILEHLVQERPVSVCANGASHFGNGVENVAYLTVYFNSGLIAHFHNNWISPVKIRTVLIGGSKKMILYDDMQASEKIKIYDKGVEITSAEQINDARIAYRLGDMWAPNLDTTEALRRVASEFMECIQSGRSPRTDGTSGLNVVRILEASEMSIKRRGHEVML
jgi:predicted dehydrogenase